MAALLKLFFGLLLVSSSSAFLEKVFKGCDENVVKRKMGEVQQCAMGELQDLQQMLAESGSGGGSDPSALLAQLRTPTYRNVILPEIGKLICKKRLKLLNCTAGIVSLDCLEKINYIAMKVAFKMLIRPVFKYVCEDIIEKDALGDLIKCGLDIYPNIMRCKPEVKGLAKVEAVCSLMKPTYECVESTMVSVCTPETLLKVRGLVETINDGIGCPFPSPNVATNENSTVDEVNEILVYSNFEQDKKVHVNVNRFYKSSSSYHISSALAMVISGLLVTAMR